MDVAEGSRTRDWPSTQPRELASLHPRFRLQAREVHPGGYLKPIAIGAVPRNQIGTCTHSPIEEPPNGLPGKIVNRQTRLACVSQREADCGVAVERIGIVLCQLEG